MTVNEQDTKKVLKIPKNTYMQQRQKYFSEYFTKLLKWKIVSKEN